MIPTLRSYLLLTLGGLIVTVFVALGGGGNTIVIALVLMLLFDIVILLLALLDIWNGRQKKIRVTRQPQSKLSIGRDNPVILTLQSGDRPATVQIRDGYPLDYFTVSQAFLSTKIAAYETKQLTYTAKPTLRGAYKWGKIQVRQLSPWGLVWMDWKTHETEIVNVYPDLLALRSLTIHLALQTSGALKQRRKFGIGTEFAELREYGEGDDPRLIDWKATARRSRPLVRVLEPEQEQTMIIMLDRGRLMTANVESLQRFDWGLNAALALALTGIKRGDRVGVAVFDRAIHTWIPPQRGEAHFQRLLEKLTPIQPDLTEPDYLTSVNSILSQQSSRALVVVITDLIDTTASSELLVALGRLAPRYLPFCVALRDPEIDRIAHSTEDGGDRLTAAYERSVALDLLAQRQVAFEQLKRKGVLVLDAPVNQISDQLVDRYLQLKMRNQL
ncbi:MAG: DUF58 domain-containing protein [Alkalinema sp. CAN_BIN05]|nr:DUF58 domain-containing protein [Alkalinema sp. CAN_BIN05]